MGEQVGQASCAQDGHLRSGHPRRVWDMAEGGAEKDKGGFSLGWWSLPQDAAAACKG